VATSLPFASVFRWYWFKMVIWETKFWNWLFNLLSILASSGRLQFLRRKKKLRKVRDICAAFHKEDFGERDFW
jgi:hypothetical protein